MSCSRFYASGRAVIVLIAGKLDCRVINPHAPQPT
jgi:hypothetical protein